MGTLQPLTTEAQLDAALRTPGPILIFKHSPTCGLSAQAYEEVEALLAGPPPAAPVYCVLVDAARAVSRAIAARLQVRHQSPQILLVDRGAVLWQASHFRVTGAQIRSALARSAQPVA